MYPRDSVHTSNSLFSLLISQRLCKLYAFWFIEFLSIFTRCNNDHRWRLLSSSSLWCKTRICKWNEFCKYACSQLVTTLRNTETWNTIHLTPYSLFYLIFFIFLYMFISFHLDDTVPLTVYLASVRYYCKGSCRYFCFAGECACWMMLVHAD